MASYGMDGKSGQWHPTVKYLLILVFAEILLMALARTFTRHGG